ncbi:MAG: alpha/beta fold hydrolase [Candidatus Promineifilaceae bacterium]|nr:alpha/beta fold hydrolase [Candidatus Promineifilaceae bacterium]
MNKLTFIIPFLVLLIVSGCFATNNDDTQTLPLSACSIPGGIEAMCGTISVLENRSLADSRQLELNIAVIPAKSSFPEPDPLIMLAGGPGQAATAVFAPYVNLLEDLNEERDIVLVDQRGTGDSSPLTCEELSSEDEDPNLTDEQIIARIQECAREIAQTADLTQYTTAQAVADFDAAREALGYEQINLYGVSYGTRAAQAYARQFPQRVRTMTLDAVTSPELILFLQMPRDGQRALEMLFERCAADAVCNEAYPDFAAEYEILLERLAEDPQEISLIHPQSGKEIQYTLTGDRLANMVYALLYSTDLVSLLPLGIHEAYENENYAPLVTQGILVGEGAGMNLGLLYAVTCAEDAPLIDLAEAEEIRREALFPLRAEFFLDVCQAYPHVTSAGNIRQPLRTDIPVLLLSGDADPVTPPYYADQVAENLANSEHIVVPGFGHGLLGVGCMSKIFSQFVSTGVTSELDTACLEKLEPPPFFVDLSGPEA